MTEDQRVHDLCMEMFRQRYAEILNQQRGKPMDEHDIEHEKQKIRYVYMKSLSLAKEIIKDNP